VDSNQVVTTFNELRSNIEACDRSTRSMLPVIAGRLQRATQNCCVGEWCQALTALKRELRNWDITKQQWIEPR
jgi:hypothetical protein